MASIFRARIATLVALSSALAAGGCQQPRTGPAPLPPPPRALVVAPVLNLSNSHDFDPIKVTDLIASEFLSFSGISVVPVNRVLAELARRGRASVETPEEAVELARAFGADATIVVAVTEYNPYEPPVVGLIMQWYSAAETGAIPTTVPADGLSERRVAPRWQVQRVFNAADRQTQEELEDFGKHRNAHESPYGDQRYAKSQEWYLRYCGWSLIRTMLGLDDSGRVAAEPHEAGR